MTIFYTEGFKLDLSHLSITFSEENSFFEKDIIKQQSFPFKIKREKSFISFFEFVDSHNSVDSNKYVKGILFKDDKYYNAEILVLSVTNEINAVFYYNVNDLDILDLPLKSLPWPDIDLGDDVYQFAKDTIGKDYPETPINFHEVYHPEKYKDYDWGTYSGFINKNINGEFQRDLVTGSLDSKFMNEIRPFVYVQKIIEFIFDQIGYTVEGEFIDDPSVKLALQYHDNPIFYTNETFNVKDDYEATVLENDVSGYGDQSIVYNVYGQGIYIPSYGTYTLDFSISGEFNDPNEACYVEFFLKGNKVASFNIQNEEGSNNFSQNLQHEFHLLKEDQDELLEIKVICSGPVFVTLSSEYEINGTKRPLYRNSFNLSKLLPDTTVGQYIMDIEDTFLLSSVFDEPTKTITYDFFKNNETSGETIDLSIYTKTSVTRKLNKAIGYKVLFSDNEILYLDKKGDFITPTSGFSEYVIPIQPLKLGYSNAQPIVHHQDHTSITFFKSNSLAKPSDSNEVMIFTRFGFVHRFLREWMFQKLNSETYSHRCLLPIHIACKISVTNKLWFYNNFFIAHKIQRSNLGLLFQQIKMELFKLKSVPLFTYVIDDGSGSTSFLPPSIIVNDDQSNNLVTNYSVTPIFYDFTPYKFTIILYADGSSDPQGLELSFGWEIINDPVGRKLTDTLEPLNEENSIIQFTRYGFNGISGDHVLRLTVYNSQGLSSSQNLTITV